VKTSLTGIKPTNKPHLGNYLGAIRPALELQKKFRTFYFIPDYHAITTLKDPELLSAYTHDVAATWLACGLDPEHTLLYRQSDVIEVLELTWIFACVVATGQLERGHAYKDAMAKGGSPNAGIFNYPLLMAADIILFDADVVPVGEDQKQHIELARDIANRLNHLYGDGTVVVPEPLITEAPLVLGLDGEKMSKSAGNTIPLFDDPKKLRKIVMSIETGSEGLDDPKDPETSTVFQLYRLVAPEAKVQEMEERLRKGTGYGWGHAKEALFEALEEELGPKRDKFRTLRENEHVLEELLEKGAERARAIARRTMGRVRQAIGIDVPRARDIKTTLKLKK